MYEHDFCEYAVKKKVGGTYLAKLVLGATAAAVFVLCFFALILPAVGLFYGAIILLLFATLVWYLSRFYAIEYEYTQTGGTFDAAAVYNKQYRRELVSIDLKKSARLVAPYKGGLIEGGFIPKKRRDLRSSPDAPNPYVIIYDTGDGDAAVIFDATARIVNNMHMQVPAVTVVDPGLSEEA